jgi:hypothetical protein
MFTYVVSDGRGGTATGSVFVQVLSANSAPNHIGGLTVVTNGIQMHFAGIPGYSYTVQRSTDLSTWTDIGSFLVPENGIAEFTDTNPPVDQAFYRTALP